MSKHTPGPWHWRAVEQKGFTSNGSPYTHIRGIVASAKISPIGGIPSGSEFIATQTTIANASLIAAAPEMLEQLKKLRDALVRYAGPEAALYEVGDANQIIAKAEGL